MAHQTGSAKDIHFLLDQLHSFCLANGWQEHLWIDEDDGKRLHLQKGNLFVNLKSSNDSKLFSLPTNGLAINISDGFDSNLPWHLQTGSPQSVRKPEYGTGARIHKIIEPIIKFHFFQYDNPEFVIVVIEYQSQKYQWLFFGQSEKLTEFNNGAIFGASWGRYNSVYHSQNNTFIPFYAGGDTANSFIRADIDGYSWLCSGKLSSKNDHGNTGRLIRGINFVDSELMPYSPNLFNGLSVLYPITLYAEREDQFWSPIAQVPHIRYVMIDHFTPGEKYTVGSQDYLIFPFHVKAPNTQSGGETNQMGIAIPL